MNISLFIPAAFSGKKKNSKVTVVVLFFLILFALGCKEDLRYKATLEDAETIHSGVKQLTNVIVHDIFSPPVASRIYSYSSIAAFEALAQSPNSLLVSLSGQINGLTDSPKPESDKINFNLAAVYAHYFVGKALIFSEEKMESYINEYIEKLKRLGLPSDVHKASENYGKQIANHILAWADKDMYKQTRSFPKYSIREEEKYWKPTPPDYMEGIEPHWNKIRTLVLDSANQFPPILPHPFSLETGSAFHNDLTEVYSASKNLTEEQIDIAKFWDCNPYVSTHKGHAMFATKKITPGGHWMGITAIAARLDSSSFEKSVAAYTLVSISLFDGFISCWDEKWRSIVVRPETLINKYIDNSWVPLLQTPPFPEYTSGHSVISSSAAVSLTKFYGDSFAYTDTVEVEYGLPVRSFSSFMQAADEAAISRMYGGIHYRMAIENGVNQGRNVGDFISKKLKLFSDK